MAALAETDFSEVEARVVARRVRDAGRRDDPERRVRELLAEWNGFLKRGLDVSRRR